MTTGPIGPWTVDVDRVDHPEVANLAPAVVVGLRITYVALAAAVLAYAARAVAAFGATEAELADLAWWAPLGDAAAVVVAAALVAVEVTLVLVVAWWADATRVGHWTRTVERLTVRAAVTVGLLVAAHRTSAVEWASLAAAGAAVAAMSAVSILTDLVFRVAAAKEVLADQAAHVAAATWRHPQHS
jgi:hypothetical protein